MTAAFGVMRYVSDMPRGQHKGDEEFGKKICSFHQCGAL